jgi:DNA-directed RNA polymerase subunit M/transcription elongation factor TFIIS
MARMDEYGRNQIDPQELDRYITGNWGEDSVVDDEDAATCPKCGSPNTHITDSGEGEQDNYQPAGYTAYHCDGCGNDWTDA